MLAVFIALFSTNSYSVSPPIDGTAGQKSDKTVNSNISDSEIRVSVLENQDTSIENGRKTFNQTCVYCHGHEGSGGKAKPLKNRKFEADYLFKTISKGKRRGSLVMPPWEKSLSEKQRWELVTFILSLSK